MMKKSKKPTTKIKNCPSKKLQSNLVIKTSEPIGFPDNIVIIQHKLMFPKTNWFRTDSMVV